MFSASCRPLSPENKVGQRATMFVSCPKAFNFVLGRGGGAWDGGCQNNLLNSVLGGEGGHGAQVSLNFFRQQYYQERFNESDHAKQSMKTDAKVEHVWRHVEKHLALFKTMGSFVLVTKTICFCGRCWKM